MILFFDNIETKDLVKSIEYYEDNNTMACLTINCNVCPLRRKLCGCVKKPNKAISKKEKYKLFRDELEKRRKQDMSDWINLDIGNIPSDFFVNERYEIQYEKRLATGMGVNSTWRENENNSTTCKIEMLNDIYNGSFKYRYRLKPLESIRITKQMVEDIALSSNAGNDQIIPHIEKTYGRPVEIIKER